MAKFNIQGNITGNNNMFGDNNTQINISSKNEFETIMKELISNNNNISEQKKQELLKVTKEIDKNIQVLENEKQNTDSLKFSEAEEIKNAISESNTKKAFALLKNSDMIRDNNQYLNSLIVIEANYNSLMNELIINTVDSSDAQITKNKINNSLLKLIDMMNK